MCIGFSGLEDAEEAEEQRHCPLLPGVLCVDHFSACSASSMGAELDRSIAQARMSQARTSMICHHRETVRD